MRTRSVKYGRNTVAKAKLKRGDVIKISRSTCSGLPCFYHYAVYEGGNNVIHLTKGKTKGNFCKCPDDVTYVEGNTEPVCIHCGKYYTFAVVSEPLERVLGKSEFTVNDRDTKDSPLPKGKIIDKAEFLLGPVNYSLSRSNCEHFANWCRYGVADSVQSLIKWFNVKLYKEYTKKLWITRSTRKKDVVNGSEYYFFNS